MGRAGMVSTVTLVTAQWVLLEITDKQVACPCSPCQNDIHRINKLLFNSSKVIGLMSSFDLFYSVCRHRRLYKSHMQ